MLELLKKKGELENTIIIVTSDNGMPFPRVKGHVYEYANHLPFAVMWKGHIQNAGRKIQDYISFIDIAPTFLEMAGVAEKKSGMQTKEGRSFADILASKNGVLIDAKRDHVLLGRERTDVGRPHDQGYPVRGIVKNGYIYTKNYAPDRWPSGNPETGYMDTDNSPTKTAILTAYKNGEEKDLYQLNFGKRTADELYNKTADTFCIKNLASDKKYAGLLQQMKKQMEQELKKQNDPRMFGKGDVFDKYPHAKPEMQNYYDRYIKGERVRKRTGADVD
jgi:arylsulfatase A-like enzyme